VRFIFDASQFIPSGNRCNKHILGLGQHIKKSLQKADIIGYQFGTVGVSDGISMGTFGMSYSLQSRDLIADQVETAAGGHWLDGMVVIPGCDKNMPGVLIAREFIRISKPCSLRLIRRLGVKLAD
jgi:dihydroxy-acid dehydratase